MIREPAKALYDKQYVTDKNIDIWMNPYLHKVGTYIQLKSEKISHHLEDIVLAQAIHHKPIDNIQKCVEKLRKAQCVRYAHNSSGYELEDYLSDRYRISVATVLKLQDNNLLQAHRYGMCKPVVLLKCDRIISIQHTNAITYQTTPQATPAIVGQGT